MLRRIPQLAVLAGLLALVLVPTPGVAAPPGDEDEIAIEGGVAGHDRTGHPIVRRHGDLT